MPEHTSLYRRYRPQLFSDVVGQQHVTQTLANAVAEGATAHAYLFAGPRGTGKTTTARILAKALECDAGPTPTPDGTCEQCVEIAEGRHPDVFELDAASRTGVDNVREEIIGRVNLAPARGRSKVYIIDEVHMLSTAAFNALLKTLEEPPSHVVFVLCTTHPHKVPETIQSRCQRFDFRRISIEDIAGRLRTISDAEQITVPDGALSLIARHAQGGMRDAITTLEQLAAFGGDTISMEDVEGLLGEVDSDQLFEVSDLVERRDIAGLFRWVAAFVETGADIAEFVRALTGHVRDLYVASAVEDPRGVVDRPSAEIPRLETQAREFGSARLSRMLDLLGELAAETRWSSDPRLSLEVALTRMARPQGELTLEALDERVTALEAGAPVREVAQMKPSAASESPRVEPPATDTADTPDEPSTGASAAADSAAQAAVQPPTSDAPAADVALDRAAVRRAWPAVLAEMKKTRPARSQLFAAAEVDLDSDGRTLVIEFGKGQEFQMNLAADEENRALLRSTLGSVLHAEPPFRYQLGRGSVRPAEGSEPRAASEQAAPAPAAEPESPAEPAAEPSTGDQLDEAPPPRATPVAAASGTGSSDELDRLLVEQLGAKLVAEQPHEPKGEDG